MKKVVLFVAVALLARLARLTDGARVVGSVTQQELANRVGASREMVSRVLTALRNAGLIHMKGKHITLSEAFAGVTQGRD